MPTYHYRAVDEAASCDSCRETFSKLQTLSDPLLEDCPACAQPVRRVIRAAGAEVVPCAPTMSSRTETLERVIADTGAEAVPPFDDARIIAGQGTAALELMDGAADLDLILVPVGGGGLIAGTLLAARSMGSVTKPCTVSALAPGYAVTIATEELSITGKEITGKSTADRMPMSNRLLRANTFNTAGQQTLPGQIFLNLQRSGVSLQPLYQFGGL